MFLLEWWNFLFAAPLVAGVVIAVVAVLAGLGGEGDHSGHVDAHVHLDTDGGHGHTGAEGHHHEAGDSDARGFDLLGWFGIGRGVSLTLMLPILLVGWGLTGLVLNQLFAPVLRIPNLYAPIAALGAILGASFVARNFARAFVKLSDTNRKTSVHTGELVGCRGSSVFEVTAEAGAANIKDPYGNIHRVSVRTRGEHLDANTAVEVLEFRDGVYLVAARS